MKKLKYIIGLLLFAIFLNVKADDSCTIDELSRLKEFANNVEIIKNLEIDDSRYDEKTNTYDELTAFYTIKITNLTDDLLVFIKTKDNNKESINNDEIDNLVFSTGDVATFYIYAYTIDSCTNNLLRTITVKFDNYNFYYWLNKEKCSKNPGFKYCKEYFDIGNIGFDEIDELFDKYISENQENNKTNFINDNLYLVISGIIILLFITIVVTIIMKKYKKSKL